MDGRLELIEVAYRLELEGEALLRELLDTLAQTFEPRRPLLGLHSQIGGDGQLRYHALATRRDSAEALAPVFELARTSATTGDHRRMFYGRPGRYSLTTLVSREVHGVARAAGVSEFVGLNCPALDTNAIAIGAACTERHRPSAAERAFWDPVARHLGVALRLRGSLRRHDPDAVVRLDGTIAHASGEARSAPARERLRQLVLARERRRSRRAVGAPLWPEFVEGRWTLIDRFESDGRRYVVACRNDAAAIQPRALTARERSVLERIARGEANKAIALDLRLSEATVSRAATAALAKLGSNLADLAALAAATRSPMRVGTLPLAVATVPPATVGVLASLDRLSSGERAVIVLALRGLSNRQIAAIRGRSVRTVINQLGAAYEKLGIQSRRELVLRWSGA
jgi:DNA-binding NarL/FixJ family response regulator